MAQVDPVRKVKIDNNSRIFLPAVCLKQVNLEKGDTVVVRAVDGELRIVSLKSEIKKGQEIFKKYKKTKGSTLDLLFEERRKEVEKFSSDR